MVGLLNLYATPSNQILTDPLPTAPKDHVERFELEFAASRAPDRAGYYQFRRAELYQQLIDRAQAVTGQVFDNPTDYPDMTPEEIEARRRVAKDYGHVEWKPPAESFKSKKRELEEKLSNVRRLHPELADPETFDAQIAREATELRRSAAEAVGLGGGFGGFLGGVAGEMSNPIVAGVTLATLPFGGSGAAISFGRGLLAGAVKPMLVSGAKAAGIEGGISGFTEILVQLADAEVQEKLGTDPGLGARADAVIDATIGGALFGASFRALADTFRLVRGGSASGAERDALAALDSATLDQQTRPVAGGAAAQRAYEENSAAAGEAVARGEAPPDAKPLGAAVPRRPATGGIRDVTPEEAHDSGREAARRVLEQGERRVEAAVYRPDAGNIRFDLGVPGDPARSLRGGWGLSHIKAKRDSEGLDGADFVLNQVPRILAFGRLARAYGPANGRRWDIELEGQRVTISLMRHGRRESWVVTGFPIQEKGGSGGSGGSGGPGSGEGGPGGTGGVNPGRTYAPAPSGIQATEGAGPGPNVGARAADDNQGAPAEGDGVAYTPQGRRVELRYQLVEAEALIASHGLEGSRNPIFPEELQPRQRDRAASQAQIAEIAGQLEPERLGRSAEAGSGAPIVGPDGIVESGNGRTLAILRAYREGLPGAARYRAFLEALGHDLTGLERPVLIARRTTPLTPAERLAFTREANDQVGLQLGRTEQAAADRALLDSVLERSAGGDLEAAANRAFVEAFVAGLPKEARGGLIDADGRMTADGLTRVRNALVARAYEDQAFISRLIESSDEGLRGIGDVLRRVALDWARLRWAADEGLVPAGLDVTADLRRAIETIDRARLAKEKIADHLGQLDAFSEMTPATRLLIPLFFNEALTRQASKTRIEARLRAFLDEAFKIDPDPNLFGQAVPGGREVLEGVVTRERQQAAGLFAEQKTRHDALREEAARAEEGELTDALEDEARALVAEKPDATMPIDGDGNERLVSEVLDEADAEIAAAETALDCAIRTAKP